MILQRGFGVWESESPVHPLFPSQPALIRTRASYRKQSSCLMTSLLNPWGEMGGDLSLRMSSVYFNTQIPKNDHNTYGVINTSITWLYCII